MRMSVVFFLALSISAFSPAAKPTKSTLSSTIGSLCHASMKKLASAGEKILHPFRHELDVEPSVYAELRDKTVSSYFKKGKISGKGIDALIEDYKKVAHNFSRMQVSKSLLGVLGGKKGPELDEAAIREKLLGENSIGKHGSKTLENLLLDSHFEKNAPEESIPWKEMSTWEKLQLASYYSSLPLYWGVGKPVLVVGSTIKNEFKWIVRGIFVGMATLGVRIFTDPVNMQIDVFMNQYFGHAGNRFSLALSGADRQVEEIKLGMAETIGKMAEVNRKYKMNDMDHREAMRIWGELEQTFLAYRNELNSLVPDHFATGRTYFRDGNIYYPMLFSIALLSGEGHSFGADANLRLIDLKKEIGELKASLDNKDGSVGGLSEKEKEDLAKYELVLKADRSRLGTLCAMMRVHEMMYPEFTRAKFMSNNPEMVPLMKTYEKVMTGLKLDDFADEYLEEMNHVFKELNIPEAEKRHKPSETTAH